MLKVTHFGTEENRDGLIKVLPSRITCWRKPSAKGQDDFVKKKSQNRLLLTSDCNQCILLIIE